MKKNYKMLKTKVKAGSITNLTDARYFAAWEVEWLGFNFEEGAVDYILPQKMKAIKEWVDGVKMVGEFGTHSAAEIAKAVEVLSLDAIQVGLYTRIEDLVALKGNVIIREVVVEKTTTEMALEKQLVILKPYVHIFLLDFDKNKINWSDLKIGRPISISFLKRLCKQYQVLLALDFKAEMLEELLTTLQAFGLHLKGGEEEAVGIKSFDELDEILEKLERVVD